MPGARATRPAPASGPARAAPGPGRTALVLSGGGARAAYQVGMLRGLVELGVDHLMASSAIPIFFPSIEVEGRQLGDGCIRNTAPLSPAINLGADRILAIGVSGPERLEHAAPEPGRPPPTIAQIAGVLLDAVMLDAIEVDVEHSGRVNRSLLARPDPLPSNPFRWVDVLWLSPSGSVTAIARADAEAAREEIRTFAARGAA